MALKVFNNLAKKRKLGYSRYHNHLAKKRLESNVLLMAQQVIGGRVTHFCLEVSREELPLLLEVLSEERLSSVLVFQQLEEPTQFVFGLREIEV